MTTAPANWTFFTNHAHVLICLASDTSATMRKISEKIGITERAIQQIIADLAECGYVDRIKIGRRNAYRVHMDRHLKHPVGQNCLIGSMINLICNETPSR